MGKNTSILLGDYYEKFVNEKIADGKYTSVSEVIREALRLFEYEENKDLSLFKPIKVTPTTALKSISFSMIAPFFYFWLKMLVERYFDKLELIYIHFPKEQIFKN